MDQGNAMAQHVLTEQGTVIPIQTLHSLTPVEYNSPTEKLRRDSFNSYIIGDLETPVDPQKIWKIEIVVNLTLILMKQISLKTLKTWTKPMWIQ